MDKRIVFFFVFFFTLLSTIAVTAVSLINGHKLLDTILYALVTMWIMGIVSQLLIHHLYMGIIKPIEDEKNERSSLDLSETEFDVDEIEEIEQLSKVDVRERDKEVSNKHKRG